MVTKLKSISNQIPWWLACRAGIAGVAWYLFPAWLFVAVACYLYGRSFFQAGRLLWLFLVMLFLSLGLGVSWWGFVIVCFLFFFLLGIKDLVFIDRKQMVEVLGVSMLFLGSLEMGMLIEGVAYHLLPLLFVIPTFVFFLIRSSATRYTTSQVPKITHREGKQRFLRNALGAFLVGEYGVVVASLPLEVIGTSTLLFMGFVAIFFATGEERGVVEAKASLWIGIIAAIAVIALAVMNWTL
ncbi:MAG: hypothetical protein NUV53_00940 [Patescibacteria group bacterium]|nr:hypothetical protein [Patescibacteria group bacterium]